ncbi:hypothetical protein MRB53_042360 [Persea americana]|nr:hypothetical protein MRB53_042360 [Persea americana]
MSAPHYDDDAGDATETERDTRRKSVQFDLPSASTEDSNHEFYNHNHVETSGHGAGGQHQRGRDSRNAGTNDPIARSHTPAAGVQNGGTRSHQPADHDSDLDSDVTEDLPPRFDAQGRPTNESMQAGAGRRNVFGNIFRRMSTGR